jgi:hypothetical protein
MKALYHTCFADPWIKVAQKLKEEYGYEPVYWIGYEDDNSKILVPLAFPDCIYQNYFDAWKGIFPSRISKHYSETYINVDFIKEYASFELQALKMMDRMDPDQYSFNFMERQRHYRNMIKFCYACISYLKIDIVICDYVPHRISDYAMYLLCRFYNIRFVYLGITQFQKRLIPLTDLSSINDKILTDYNIILQSGKDASLLKAELPDDIIMVYNKTQLDYSAAKPDYERLNVLKHKETSGFFSLIKKFFKDLIENYKSRYSGPDGFFRKGIPTYFKQKKRSIQESRYSLIQYSLNKLKTNRYKNRLEVYYNSLVIEPDYNIKYVFFGLHYQPELTSSPSGDIFVDQRLCIDVLHKQLPPDCLIYVKEHPSQFHSHLEGHTSRAKYFYDDLLTYSRVRFIPLDSDPFKLIKNAQAIATVVGTLGWEAMVMGKPVIAFGLIWYEKYEGVLKISNEETASKIKEFIINFKYDEKRLFAYLSAFGKNSSIAYAHRDMKEKVNISETDCIDHLTKLILGSVNSDQVI